MILLKKRRQQITLSAPDITLFVTIQPQNLAFIVIQIAEL
jgi:hypothetical protein